MSRECIRQLDVADKTPASAGTNFCDKNALSPQSGVISVVVAGKPFVRGKFLAGLDFTNVYRSGHAGNVHGRSKSGSHARLAVEARHDDSTRAILPQNLYRVAFAH